MESSFIIVVMELLGKLRPASVTNRPGAAIEWRATANRLANISCVNVNGKRLRVFSMGRKNR